MTDTPDEPHEPWNTLSRTPVVETPWLVLRQDRVRTHTDVEITYTYLERPESVFVVPVTARGEVVLLRQYRYPVRAWCWEVPAGAWDADEDGMAAAARELKEEVGGVCQEMRSLGAFYSANGVSNERFHVYLALGVTLGANQLEHTELLHVVPLPRDEVLRMAHAGEITDGPSALALLLCEPHLAND